MILFHVVDVFLCSYDTDPFLFYILCEVDAHGCHLVAYFSKVCVSSAWCDQGLRAALSRKQRRRADSRSALDVFR